MSRLHKSAIRWIGMAVLALAVAIAWTLAKWPVPAIHDEFSYLLGADTLAHGRFANPTHVFWRHFESFHINWNPAYVSKYPVGSFLFLAIGSWLGEPVIGLWIAFTVALLAILWAARGIVSWRWSIIAGVLLLVNPVLHSCWTQSYLSGWPAVASSALYFGAILRLRRGWRTDASVVAAVGLLGMAMTRPFEGLLAAIAGAALLIAYWCKLRRGIPKPPMACVTWATVTMLCGASVWAYYNHATTGSWRTMPYQIHEREYGWAPVLLFLAEPKHPPEYRHVELLRFHRDWSMPIYQRQRTIGGFVHESVQRTSDMMVFWGWTLGLIPLCTSFHWGRWHIARYIGVALIALLLSTSLVPWLLPHYLACMLPLAIILATLGIQHLARRISFRRHKTIKLAIAIVLLHIPIVVANLLAQNRLSDNDPWSLQRQQIQADLESNGSANLVFVHYERNHNPHHEWVYNRADIDGSPVVWAREINLVEDNRLMDYFSHRRVWRLDADEPNRKLELLREPTR